MDVTCNTEIMDTLVARIHSEIKAQNRGQYNLEVISFKKTLPMMLEIMNLSSYCNTLVGIRLEIVNIKLQKLKF
jgi:hypothetical protein